jgi:hypothetical protein
MSELMPYRKPCLTNIGVRGHHYLQGSAGTLERRLSLAEVRIQVEKVIGALVEPPVWAKVEAGHELGSMLLLTRYGWKLWWTQSAAGSGWAFRNFSESLPNRYHQMAILPAVLWTAGSLSVLGLKPKACSTLMLLVIGMVEIHHSNDRIVRIQNCEESQSHPWKVSFHWYKHYSVQ